MDREAALANMRFTFLQHLCEKTVVRPRESREHRRSMQIDQPADGKSHRYPLLHRDNGYSVPDDVQPYRSVALRPDEHGRGIQLSTG